MTQDEEKAAFAAFILQGMTPFEAAQELYPDPSDLGKVGYIATNWATDPMVVLFKQKLMENGDADANELLFTKANLLNKLWRSYDTEKMLPDERSKMAETIAKIAGFIDKDTGKGTTINADRVMIVNQFANPNDYLEHAANQQARLIHDSTSKH